MDFGDLYYQTFDDNQKEKSDSIWEILDFFRDNYVVERKEADKIIEKIGKPKLLNNKADELHIIYRRNDTGPKDIAKFFISLHQDFPVNVNTEAIEKIIKYKDEEPSSKDWVKFFKEKFPTILNKHKSFGRVINVIITLMNEKLHTFMDTVVDKVGEFTDFLGSKLPTFDDNNNFSDSQNQISNMNP
jgi:hypothetical protein